MQYFVIFWILLLYDEGTINMKTPSGANFPYYYKNGALHGIHFADYKDDIVALLRILEKEQAFIVNQNITSTTWLDCYYIKYSKEVFLGICSFLEKLSNKLTRCAFVGLGIKYKIRIYYFIKKTKINDLQIRYYNDPEIAKTWLVGKIH